MSRAILVDGVSYTIPTDLTIMYVDGHPFCHFQDGNVDFDEKIMNKYSICIEPMPFECPENLGCYIKEKFKKATDDDKKTKNGGGKLSFGGYGVFS
jgi:hypothetical protein